MRGNSHLEASHLVTKVASCNVVMSDNNLSLYTVAARSHLSSVSAFIPTYSHSGLSAVSLRVLSHTHQYAHFSTVPHSAPYTRISQRPPVSVSLVGIALHHLSPGPVRATFAAQHHIRLAISLATESVATWHIHWLRMLLFLSLKVALHTLQTQTQIHLFHVIMKTCHQMIIGPHIHKLTPPSGPHYSPT